jgi:hypothetical protein
MLLVGLLLLAAGVLASTAGRAEPAADWRPLFDGKALGQWKPTPFGGEGEVTAADGVLRIAMGADLSGVTWKGEFPKQNFEVALEARRVEGSDFFCGLTFPVGESHCSLILGGWGGGVVGLVFILAVVVILATVVVAIIAAVFLVIVLVFVLAMEKL